MVSFSAHSASLTRWAGWAARLKCAEAKQGGPRGAESLKIRDWDALRRLISAHALVGALQKQRSPLTQTDLEQFPDGSPYLSSYCDSDLFASFDQTFRALIEEWVALLSAVGGIQPFLSTAAISRLYSETPVEEP
jgi:hypothetical protein